MRSVEFILDAMIKSGPVFTRPRTPAAKCLHIIRLNPVVTRSELVEATGLSQPTITRATAALLGAGLIRERTDLTQSRGRGRPTVPLEVADNDWMLAGIAVGTAFTRIAFFDTKGRTLCEEDVATPVFRLSEGDVIEHIIAGMNRLMTGLDRRLVSVGATTSGSVDESGRVTAHNLGWDRMDIASRLQYQFGVPVVVSSVIPAILGSETQSTELGVEKPVMVLYADDSVGAALTVGDEITSLELTAPDSLATQAVLTAVGAESLPDAVQDPSARALLDDRARSLGTIAASLVAEHAPDTLVVAGGAFSDDPAAPKLFAATVRQNTDQALELRMIPSPSEIVRACTRAVALDPLLRVPLELGREAKAA